MTRSFYTEQQCFAALKQNTKQLAVEEYVTALDILLRRYNTTIYENRFVVGGALELFTLFLLQNAGIAAQAYGDETAEGDLILPRNKMLSIKGVFTSGRHTARLINTMGDAEPEWKTATLFVLADVGIVYGDPSMIDPAKHLTKTRDALVLNASGLETIMSREKNIFSMPIPRKPDTRMTRQSLKASEAVARQIIIEARLKTLQAQMR
ncbi:MAG: hypothetical protein ACON4P_03420 [Candidatus Puniceispirillales bacterium]